MHKLLISLLAVGTTLAFAGVTESVKAEGTPITPAPSCVDVQQEGTKIENVSALPQGSYVYSCFQYHTLTKNNVKFFQATCLSDAQDQKCTSVNASTAACKSQHFFNDDGVLKCSETSNTGEDK